MDYCLDILILYMYLADYKPINTHILCPGIIALNLTKNRHTQDYPARLFLEKDSAFFYADGGRPGRSSPNQKVFIKILFIWKGNAVS
jgi:hypothetical protein